MIKPYPPTITMADILAYQPDNAATHTPAPIVNAVCEVLYHTTFRQARTIATMLEVNYQKLLHAVELETGLPLKDIIMQYRIAQFCAYRDSHPGMSSSELAKACGFSSYHALWRFVEHTIGQTPSGEKSNATEDAWTRYARQLRQKGKK